MDFATILGTNIDDALTDALELLANTNMNSKNPTIIFLTDGEATVGEQNSDSIIENIKMNNPETIVTIHSISFGRGADFSLLKRISLENHGLARKIYEDSDSALQIQGFYAEISNPLLSSMSIEYLNDTVEVDSLVKEQGYTYYDGSEVVVVGKFLPDFNNLFRQEQTEFKSQINGIDASGDVSRFFSSCIPYPYPPCMCRMPPCPPCPPPVWPTTGPPTPSPTPLPADTIGGFVERMWAYLTIKKLLDESKYLEKDAEKKEEMRDRALQLSLTYNFVTELTSMVVIQEDVDGNSSESALSERDGVAVLAQDTSHIMLSKSVSGLSASRPSFSVSSQRAGPPGASGMSGRGYKSGRGGSGSARTGLNMGIPGRPVGPPSIPIPSVDLMPPAEESAGDSESEDEDPISTEDEEEWNELLVQPPSQPAPTTTTQVAAPTCPGPDEHLCSCFAAGPTCDTPSCSSLGTNHSCQVPADCANGAHHFCDCATGFVREAGRCLEARHCPQANCTESEEPLVGCGRPFCEPECGDSPGDYIDCELLECGDWVCVCRPGLVRNDDGLCVEPSACPVKTDVSPEEIDEMDDEEEEEGLGDELDNIVLRVF